MRFHNTTPFQRDDIIGSVGTDEIFTYSGNDIVHGEAGSDLINGGLGDDQLFGGADNDIIIGEDDRDTLFGDDGNDTLLGGEGDDQIHGGDQGDSITGGKGADSLFGEHGDDTFIQHDAFGEDFIHGGDSIDTVDYNSTSSRFSINYSFGQLGFDARAVMTMERSLPNTPSSPVVVFADQWTNTLRSVERVITGGQNDTVTGNDDINVILTSGGSDILRGRGGSDIMDGGAGSDTFIYENAEDSEADVVGDFGRPGGDLILNFGDSAGNQDVIDLSRIDANRTFNSLSNESFRLDDRDGRIETGELYIGPFPDGQQNRFVSVAAADTDGNGKFDFVIRMDRVIETLDVSDFIL